jgi:hypothetical protein
MGHYAPLLLSVVVGSLIVLTLVPAASDAVPAPVLVLGFVVTIVLAGSIFAHSRRLCERCIASMPLDAATVAERYRLRFRVAHLFERRPFALGYLAILLGSGVAYAFPVGRYAWAAAQASLVYLLQVYVTHQRLQPWCPECGHGGDERAAPVEPTPISSHR